jgi:hypothetical protein
MISDKKNVASIRNLPTSDEENSAVIKPLIEQERSSSDQEAKTYDTLTVLIPGTWAPLLGPLPAWYIPSNQPLSLHAYLRESVFPGEEIRVFRWNRWGVTPAARHRQRLAAAERLRQCLQNVRAKHLRIIGHSHGANIATMITRDDQVRQLSGIHVDTLVLLNPAVDRDGSFAEYHPDMNHVGDLSVPIERRRFFTFHSVRDPALRDKWAQNYQHTDLARHEMLRGNVAATHHWSSTFPEVWQYHRLAKLVRAA